MEPFRNLRWSKTSVYEVPDGGSTRWRSRNLQSIDSIDVEFVHEHIAGTTLFNIRTTPWNGNPFWGTTLRNLGTVLCSHPAVLREELTLRTKTASAISQLWQFAWHSTQTTESVNLNVLWTRVIQRLFFFWSLVLLIGASLSHAANQTYEARLAPPFF